VPRLDLRTENYRKVSGILLSDVWVDGGVDSVEKLLGERANIVKKEFQSVDCLSGGIENG